MRYFIVDAFTDKPFGGNTAGVVLLDSDFPDEKLMLQIAAELRYSETAFIRKDSDNEFSIRYFTPCNEVELCGHATIASFAMLHHEGLAVGNCLCHTKAGNLAIEADNTIMMEMASPRIVQTITDTNELYKALGINDYKPAMPVQIAYAGLPDILLPLPDVAALQNLQPDMDTIAEITDRYNAISFHVFAFDNDGYTAHVRNFAPSCGIPEESATGTSNAALTYYLQQCGCIGANGECKFIQGEAMGHPSVIATRINSTKLYVGGNAVIVAKGEILM